jgi:hypothetical protein
MAATELTPFQKQSLREIRELWEQMKAPEAKTPEGAWFRQIESYHQVMVGSIRRRLRRLSTVTNDSQPAVKLSTEIAGMRQELEIVVRYVSVLLAFAKENS